MNIFDSFDFSTLFFLNPIPWPQTKPPSSSVEMQTLSTRKASSGSDIKVIKLRHQVLVQKYKGIMELHSHLPDLGEDMRHVMHLVREFLEISNKTLDSEPPYGHDIQNKAFRFLLDFNCIRHFSDLFNLFLRHRAAGENSPMEYLFFSEWDSHQLFSALDFNNQVVVVEKILRLITQESLLPQPPNVVLALPKPKEYSSKEWEIIILEYLKANRIFVEQASDDEVKYHLNLSKTNLCPIKTGNLYRAVEIFQPFDRIDLSHSVIDLKSSEILRSLIDTAREVDLSNSSVDPNARKLLAQWLS